MSAVWLRTDLPVQSPATHWCVCNLSVLPVTIFNREHPSWVSTTVKMWCARHLYRLREHQVHCKIPANNKGPSLNGRLGVYMCTCATVFLHTIVLASPQHILVNLHARFFAQTIILPREWMKWNAKRENFAQLARPHVWIHSRNTHSFIW